MTLADFSVTQLQDRNPGPGAYDVVGDPLPKLVRRQQPKTASALPRQTVLDSSHVTKDVEFAPPRSELSRMSKTIGLRFKAKDPNEDVPGPGGFVIENALQARGKQWSSIGLRLPPPKSVQDNPGPGAYNISQPGRIQLPPMKGRGTTMALTSSWTPSPAAYKIPTTVGRSGPQISIHPRLPDITASGDNPGFEHSVFPTFGDGRMAGSQMRAVRKSMLNPGGEKTPGPGAYEVTGGVRSSSQFGTSIRPLVPIIGEAQPAGVGAELRDLRQGVIGRDITIGRKTSFGLPGNADKAIPGPDYMPPPDHGVRHSIGLRIVERPKGQDGPGPGAYSVDLARGEPHPFAFKGPEERMDMVTSIGPGPGAYAVQTHLGDIRKAPVLGPGPTKSKAKEHHD